MEVELENGMTINLEEEEVTPTADEVSEDKKKKQNDDQLNDQINVDDQIYQTDDDSPDQTDDQKPSEDDKSDESETDDDLTQRDLQLLSVIEASGEDITDEELELIQSSKDPIVEATNVISSKRESKVQSRILDEYPSVKKFYEHLKNGGKENEFFTVKRNQFSVPDSVEENDIASQRAVVREQMKIRGFSDSEIEEDINDFEESGILYKKAQRAVSDVKQHYDQQEQQLELKRQQRIQQQQQQVQKIKQDASNVLSQNDEIAGLAIRDKKDGLVDYMFSASNDGVTQYQKDIAKLPIDKVLAIGALIRSDFDIDSFIRSKVSNERVKSMRERLKNSKKAEHRAGGGGADRKREATQQTLIGVDDLDF